MTRLLRAINLIFERLRALGAPLRGALSTEMVTRTADDEVLLTLPAFPEYEVQSPETITLTLPGAAVKSKNRVSASPAFRIRAISGSAEISGRILSRVTEEDLRSAPSGTLTFTVAITNDTFASLVGHRHIVPDATRALLSGVRSAQSEPAGWNAIVVPALQELNVARTGTLVLVTIPRVPTYDITAPETISLTIPGAVLTSGRTVRATPDIPIEAEAGSASLDGTLFERPVVDTVQAGVDMAGRALTLRITLQQDAWSAWAAAREPVDAPREGVGFTGRYSGQFERVAAPMGDRIHEKPFRYQWRLPQFYRRRPRS